VKTGGVSPILVLGIVNLMLVTFQISSGLRWIKVPSGVHRKTGIALFVSAVVHVTLGFIAQMEPRATPALATPIGPATT